MKIILTHAEATEIVRSHMKKDTLMWLGKFIDEAKITINSPHKKKRVK